MPAPEHLSTPDVQDRFLALVCRDEELLRAEFNAIIAAEWPGPPPDLPDRRVCGEPDPDGKRRYRATATRVPGPRRRSHVDVSARQRSPPDKDHKMTDKKSDR